MSFFTIQLSRHYSSAKEPCVTVMKDMKLPPLYLLLIGMCFPLVIVEGQLTATQCASLAQSANCSFYTECVERNMPCGPEGYALGYGYHFCKAFGELSGEFTSEVIKSRLQQHTAILELHYRTT